MQIPPQLLRNRTVRLRFPHIRQITRWRKKCSKISSSWIRSGKSSKAKGRDRTAVNSRCDSVSLPSTLKRRSSPDCKKPPGWQAGRLFNCWPRVYSGCLFIPFDLKHTFAVTGRHVLQPLPASQLVLCGHFHIHVADNPAGKGKIAFSGGIEMGTFA